MQSRAGHRIGASQGKSVRLTESDRAQQSPSSAPASSDPEPFALAPFDERRDSDPTGGALTGMAPAAEAAARHDRLTALAPILVFDVAGPLAIYNSARGAGLSTVGSLVVSGVLPASRVIATIARRRRVDVIGALVLSGIVLATAAGIISDNARLYLLDGLVPTVVLGGVCLLSLLWDQPMMFRIALETMGHDSPKGRAFKSMWRYRRFRRTFRVITLVWGVVFLLESALQALIIETSTINTAKVTSNVMPMIVVGLTLAWTLVYGKDAQHRSAPSPNRRG
jgi:uncharacterized membrane protein